MSTAHKKYPEQFRECRALLDVTQQQLADRLLLSRNYIAQIETGKRDPSIRVLSAMRALVDNKMAVPTTGAGGRAAANPLIDYRKSGRQPAAVEEPPAAYSAEVASRIPEQRTPSTRADCESYARRLFDAAELSEDPDAFPAIMSRLKKQFPLDEWENPDPDKK